MFIVDLPVGTKFYVDGNLLAVEVCEDIDCVPTPCGKCYFFKVGKLCSSVLSCVSSYREDGNDVIFKKVEEKQ